MEGDWNSGMIFQAEEVGWAILVEWSIGLQRGSRGSYSYATKQNFAGGISKLLVLTHMMLEESKVELLKRCDLFWISVVEGE